MAVFAQEGRIRYHDVEMVREVGWENEWFGVVVVRVVWEDGEAGVVFEEVD